MQAATQTRAAGFRPAACGKAPRRQAATQACRAALQQKRRDAAAAAPLPATRRSLLLALGAAAPLLLGTGRARAGIVQDIMKQQLRPDVEPVEAIIQLMDARGTMYDIKQIADLPASSSERISSRALIPGFAKRLRLVGPAAPVVSTLAAGGDKEAAVGELYGGQGGEKSPIDGLYRAVGQVISISGRGIRPEAFLEPSRAGQAIVEFDRLLGAVPKELLERANELRSQQRAVAALN